MQLSCSHGNNVRTTRRREYKLTGDGVEVKQLVKEGVAFHVAKVKVGRSQRHLLYGGLN